MGILGAIVTQIIVGLIAGLIALAVVPGQRSMSIGVAILLGMVGSFVGDSLGFLISHADGKAVFSQFSGIIGSIIGAIIALVIYGTVRCRS